MHQPSKKTNPHSISESSIEMTMDTHTPPPSTHSNESHSQEVLLREACELLRRRRMRQGGFVRNGLDGARYHLMETASGIHALQVFTAVGQLAPVYINQQFFDSLMDNRSA